MDRHTRSNPPSQKSLQVTEAKLNRIPLVVPVTLERRNVSMPQGHGTSEVTRGQTSFEQTEAQRTTASTSGSSSSSGGIAISSSASSGASDMVASATTFGLTSTTAATVIATTELAVAAAAPSPQISPSVSAVGAPLYSHLGPPSPSLTGVTTASVLAARTEKAATIVGGKHPSTEEGPIIILTQPKDENNQEDKEDNNQPTDLLHFTNTKANERQELATLETQKPDDSRKQVSNQQPSGGRGRETERRVGKAGVQFSSASPPRRDVAHVMEFFEEQEKNLQESFLSLPQKPTRKSRSPSPNTQQIMGLEHLDNLIKLMEQLTSLKDENSRLKKRCDYLESTKVLLQAKRDLSFECSSSSSGFKTLTSHKHEHQTRHHSHPSHTRHQDRKNGADQAFIRNTSGSVGTSPRVQRPRLTSADEVDFLEHIEYSSDQHPKRPRSAHHKRSYSTGSLEVPSEILDKINGLEKRKKIKGKSGRSSLFHGKPVTKQKSSKGSKWARVKKVLKGQKIYENLDTTLRLLRDFGKSSSHLRYSTTGLPARQGETSPSTYRPLGEPRPPERPRISPDPDSDFLVGQKLEPMPALVRSMSLDQTEHPDTEDLSEGIWMGPPDWWEEYEAHKGSNTSTASEISSVIEVTKMYLGEKKDENIVTTSIQPEGAVGGTEYRTTSIISERHSNQPEKFLKVGFTLPRRQSSPSLFAPDENEDEDFLNDLTLTSESYTRLLHKSSSCKSADLDLPKCDISITQSPKPGGDRLSKKSHRTAWGRVKDIIHTRRDSVKKKPKREKTGVESEEPSEVDIEAMMEEQWRPDSFAEGPLSRSTPKTSPLVVRQQASNEASPGQSTSGKTIQSKTSTKFSTSPTNVDVATLLASSVSDEFNKKMQEWEEKRSKKSSFIRTSLEDSELEISGISNDFPLKTVELKELGKVPDSSSPSETPNESHTSMEVLGAPSINVEEMQKRMTDSFSRKMQEWEKLKYKGSPIAQRDPSPESERKLAKVKKDDRPKSKRSREEKEKEKMERQRERDKQKVEREQIKLEKEKLRIEKERLKAMEREAKIERLKGRLSQAECDPTEFRNPMLKPYAEYKITADFARKLHEWEVQKGLPHDVSTSIYLEARDRFTMEQRRNSQQFEKQCRADPNSIEESGQSRKTESAPPPPLTLSPYPDSPDEHSPIEKESCLDMEEDAETYTSVTEEFLTKSNIASLERANTQLVEELQKKEAEYADVQEEVINVNEKLAKVREQHASEMARFNRELAQGTVTGPVQLEVAELQESIGEFEEKIKLIDNFGETLALSMESAAVGKWQSIEGEETVHKQLVDLVDQMRNMLLEATQSQEHSQKLGALSNFETLYSQAMKLQVQMNNLRLSHLERNREIMGIKRQLLLQEVNNLLLQADITRRETELYQFHEARKFASLKRWNTFSGTDKQRLKRQVDATSSSTKSHKQAQPEAGENKSNIPSISEDVTIASPPSTSTSAPASPLTFEAMVTTSSQSHSSASTLDDSAAKNTGTDESSQPTLGLIEETMQQQDQKLISSGQPDPLQTGEANPELLLSQNEVPTTSRPSPPSSTTSPTLSSLSSPSVITSSTPTTPSTPSSRDKDVQLSSGSETQGDTQESSVNGATLQPTAVTLPMTKSETVTFSDSVPLFREIEELKRVRDKVERGSPTLNRKDFRVPFPAPSPGKETQCRSTTETLAPTIPKQQQGLGKPRLTKAVPVMDDDYSPAESVMICTESISCAQSAQLTHDHKLEVAAGGSGSIPQLHTSADNTLCDLPPPSDSNKAGFKLPRSPVSKQKILQRQREERETRIKDYRAISPKGSPVATRGKPPLPRQSTPVRQSPTASPAVDKGPRSKSVGDMESRTPDSPSITPLQEAINRFEKRATVCDTDESPIELRKTPSPTLHLPRVGLVTRVRRLKPATELLEESQRYRSGHSIYATRIMQRYIPKDERGRLLTSIKDKENTSGAYVSAIVQRLSRETTPVKSGASSKNNSSMSLHRVDSPRAQSEFMSDIVRRLSSSSTDVQKSPSPLKDLTNGGQVKKLTQAFSDKSPKSSPERAFSDTHIDKHSSEMFQTENPSCPIESSYSVLSEDDSFQGRSESSIPTSHQSLPSVEAPPPLHITTPIEPIGRGRAATYPAPEHVHFSRTVFLGDTESQDVISKRSKSTEKRPGKSKGKGKDKDRHPSLSPDRPSKAKTVSELCKQSISFDLGVSLFKKSDKEAAPKQRKPRSWDPSVSAKAEAAAGLSIDSEGEPSSVFEPEMPSTSGASCTSGTSPVSARSKTERPVSIVSSLSEGEMAPGSPETAGEKKKSRRFLDSTWLQKSKKFFKVSK